MVKRYSYDVFGEPNRVSGVGNPYMFTGRNYDSETELYYYRARYYSPSIGRFLQTDPIGYADGMNLYKYVRNNPVNFRDPMGLYAGIGPWWPGHHIPEPPCGCKNWGPSIAEMLGVSVIECANMIIGEAWSGIRTPMGIGGGLIEIRFTSIGTGLSLGLGLQYLIALNECSKRECLEY